jgi:hypothetical protein
MDELGNVLQRNPDLIKKDTDSQWKVFGLLRSFAQTGRLRVIASAFQEFFLHQQASFSGPLINFFTPLRLRGLNRNEIGELCAQPLSLWAKPFNPLQLVEFVYSQVGTHPLFLQYFSRDVFVQVVEENRDVLSAARAAIQARLGANFMEAVDEVFYRTTPVTLRYLFLRRCEEASRTGQTNLSQVSLDDEWLEREFRNLGHSATTVNERQAVLEGLELRGLTETRGGSHAEQWITAPIIYTFVRRVEKDFSRLIERYKSDLEHDLPKWVGEATRR